MVGLSAQQVLQQRMDTTANNLANMTTAGFKVEHLVTRELSEKPANASDTAQRHRLRRRLDAPARFRDRARWSRPATRWISRSRARASSPCRRQAAKPTRAMDASASTIRASVVTRTGDPVLGDGGPITLDPDGGPISVSREGSISQDGVSRRHASRFNLRDPRRAREDRRQSVARHRRGAPRHRRSTHRRQDSSKARTSTPSRN